MNKIYAITKGCYSDYHICATTTDPNRAKELQMFYTDGLESAEIEEYEDNQKGMSPEFNTLNPLWLCVCSTKGEWDIIPCGYCDKNNYINQFNIMGCVGDTLRFEAKVMANDKDHALKIARDERAKALAKFLGL